MTDIVERLKSLSLRALPAHLRDGHAYHETAMLCDKAADTITKLRAEVAEANETIIAFAGPWAQQYGRGLGLPAGHLHPTHYDILAKAGARMDDFTRAALGDNQ